MHGKIAAEIVDSGLIHEFTDNDVAQLSLPTPMRRGTLVERPICVENAAVGPRLRSSRIFGHAVQKWEE
jgi:hypothetical protein